MTVTLTGEDYGAGVWWAVTVDGAVVARTRRWSHAMLLVDYLRTDRGRKSMERPEPLPEGDLT